MKYFIAGKQKCSKCNEEYNWSGDINCIEKNEITYYPNYKIPKNLCDVIKINDTEYNAILHCPKCGNKDHIIVRISKEGNIEYEIDK